MRRTIHRALHAGRPLSPQDRLFWTATALYLVGAAALAAAAVVFL